MAARGARREARIVDATNPPQGQSAKGFSRYPASRTFGVKSAIVVFNAALIAAIWIVTFGLLRADREETIRAAVGRNDTLVIALEEYTIRTIESADTILRYLIRENLRNPGGVDLEKFVADYTNENVALTGLVLVDENGDGFTTANGSAVTPVRRVNVADREHFRVHQNRDSGKLFIGKPVLGRVTGKLVVPVSRRINKANGAFGGVVIAVLEPGKLTDLLRGAKMRPLDVISVVGTDGITRARLRGSNQSSGEDISGSPLLAEQSRRPVGSYFAKGALDGLPKYFSYRTLQDYGLITIVGTAESDVLAEFHQRKSLYLWAAGMTSLMILGFLVLFLILLERQSRTAAIVARGQARFFATFNQAAMGIAHTTLDGKYLDVNQKFCEILGYTREEMRDRTLSEIVHPEDAASTLVAQDALLASDQQTASVTQEQRYVRKDADPVWCAVSISLVRDAAGTPDYFAVVIQDISDRKRSDAALRAYEEEQRRLAGQVEWERARLVEAQAVAKVGSWETDVATFSVTWSAENYLIFEVDPAGFAPTHPKFLELIHPEDREKVDRAFRDSLESKADHFSIEHRIIMADGRAKFLEERWQVHRNEHGHPVRATGTTQDVTQRENTARALRETNLRLRDLSGRLLRAEENERRRIARELHDQLGQELTALTMDLKTLAKRSGGTSDVIERCIAGVARLLDQVRDLTLTLRPSQLDDLGLVAALRGHLEHHVRVHGVGVRLETDVNTLRLYPDIEVACFRIVQEALTNMLRHARAKNVLVSIREVGDELVLEVRDDGTGFDVETALDASTRGDSLGLRNLFDRAELAGGSLRIESSSVGGTSAIARFPLSCMKSEPR